MRGNVFTDPLPRSGLHNPVIPPLLGEDDIENTASIVACWTVFTELPGNALIKSVTILKRIPSNVEPHIRAQGNTENIDTPHSRNKRNNTDSHR
jgi:hypothetical protein